MILHRAFDELLKNWSALPGIGTGLTEAQAEEERRAFRLKYKSYRSHYINGTHTVGNKIMREMLEKAGFNENYTLPK